MASRPRRAREDLRGALALTRDRPRLAVEVRLAQARALRLAGDLEGAASVIAVALRAAGAAALLAAQLLPAAVWPLRSSTLLVVLLVTVGTRLFLPKTRVISQRHNQAPLLLLWRPKR